MNTTIPSIARVCALFVTVASLAACGGGGSDAPAVAPTPSPVVPVPTPAPSEPQAISTVPAFTYIDQRKADVLNRLNTIRVSVGLGLIAQQTQIDTAAQAHTDYSVANNVQSHKEDSAKQGYTGYGAGDRETAAGYVWAAGDEVMSFGSSNGAASVDLLMSAPYHRVAMLEYGWTVAGVGISTSIAGQSFDVDIDMAYPPGGMQGAPNTPVAIFPIDGATAVPVAMLSNESPNPIPENNGALPGYPVSLQVNESKTLTVTSFTVSRVDGSLVDTKLLEPSTDVNLIGWGFKFFASALPRAPLAAGTTYYAKFVGTVDGAALTKSWSFTTAP